MAPPPERIRHRIKEIELQPNTHNYPISLQVFVDNQEVCQLPQIERGMALKWSRPIICRNVSPESEVTLEITEIHTFKDRQHKSRGYKVSSVQTQTETTLAFSETRCTAKVTLLVPATVDQSRVDALQQLKHTKLAPGVLEKLGKAQGVFQAVLDFGNAVADVHPAAKIVFSVCMVAWDKLKESERITDDTQALMDGISGLVKLTEEAKKYAMLELLKKTIEDILILLEDALIYVLEQESKSRYQALRRIIDSADRDVVDELLRRFKILQADFDSGVGVEIHRVTHDSYIRSLLDGLRPTEKSDYNSGQACLDGTREEIINNILNWSEQPCEEATNGQRMLWIHGQAGIGKSSIAVSVCKRLAERELLAASFFCKRDIPQLYDPFAVINTVAHDLAFRNQAYKEALAAEMKANPKLCTTSDIRQRYEGLFKNPMKGLEVVSPYRPLVILVDALDECREVEGDSLIECLSDLSQLAPWLKVIVTSRPNEGIKKEFDLLGTAHVSSRDVHGFDATGDIYAYLTKNLEVVSSRDGWPKDSVRLLCKMASGLFVWASTVQRFITGIKGSTLGRLNEVLMGRKLEKLDSLYTEIIRHGVGDDEEDNKEVFRRCIDAIIAVSTYHPLPLSDLRSLLREEPYYSSLEPVVESLGALLHADENIDGAIRFYHPSFVDYATDPSRSGEFYVQPGERNLDMVQGCLSTLQTRLRFNICELETSAAFNNQISDLPERVKATIDGALSYSCTYWISHFKLAAKGSFGVDVRAFLEGPQALYWLEVMSLLERMDFAVIGLVDLLELFQPDDGQDIRAIAMDLYRFTLAFYDAISASTPHLYISALALAPGSAGVCRLKKTFPRTLVVTGGDKGWPGWLRSLSHPKAVSAFAISRDSRRLVTGCEDGMVRFWDMRTGAQIGEQLVGHSDSVNSVTFSPDGNFVASGSDDSTVRIWDVKTRMAVGDPLVGHSDVVASVVFSPDGNLLVSGSDDNTARIWDVKTRMPVGDPLVGHSDTVSSVVFSPDGALVASGSWDNTVRMWDVKTHGPVGDPMIGHSDSVNCVAFSPDGALLVSGSDDNTVRTWDVKTHMPIGDPLGGHSNSVNCVAFSPDGALLVSGSDDHTVRMWDAKARMSVADPLFGHSGSVNSVGFSPDGSLVVSGSDDSAVRMWDVKTRMPAGDPLVGHSSQMNSVAFSPDGALLVSGSDDNTVQMWDARTHMPIGDPLVGHSNSVSSVVFSPNGALVASGSDDSTVRIWDVKTRMAVGDPLVGHSEAVHSVAFSPDGNLLVSGSRDYTVQIWDSKTRMPVGDPLVGHSGSVTAVAFSPDGNLLVSGSWDSTVQMWDVKTRTPVGDPIIGHSDSVSCVAFSPDGNLLVSGSWDKTVRMWDVMTRTPVGDPLLGYSNWVSSVAFSPNSALVVSGSWDNTVRIWDVKTRMPVGDPLAGHSDSVGSVAFSPDGKHLVSGCIDYTVLIEETRASNFNLKFAFCAHSFSA